jgi:hypothetical protein
MRDCFETREVGVVSLVPRKKQPGLFLAGHNRDGNGRFRILGGGDTKSFSQISYLLNLREATINEAQAER